MDDEDEFGADAEFLDALTASESKINQPINVETSITRVIQPTPQRLDTIPIPAKSSPQTSHAAKVIQPTPQVLNSRSATSSILVSPRQKGNPILANLRSFAWEYSDVPSDYVLGATTCALFLSLKYHLLHPEYVYNRIKGLHGKYNLRILLTLVDITNHEECLKELTKTSIVNNITVILCWSTAEAARYIELYKSYEYTSKDSTGIKGMEKKGYTEKMVEFTTIPRGINKTDAISIVSAFGSVRAAVNARPEEVAIIGGWGEKKVKRWCSVIDEPFRARKFAIKNPMNYESLITIIPPNNIETPTKAARAPSQKIEGGTGFEVSEAQETEIPKSGDDKLLGNDSSPKDDPKPFEK